MTSDAVAAAIITTVGSVLAASITAGTAVLVERIKGQPVDPRSRWGWIKRYGYLLGALIVVLVIVLAGSWVFYLLYDTTTSRLEHALPNVPGYKKRVYSSVGLAFAYPQNWQIEDYAFRFGGGGEMELVSDRSPDGLFETQGIVIGLDNIAEHHWADPQSQFHHVETQLQQRCNKSLTRVKASIAEGRIADLFKCSRSTNEGQIDERLYFYQYSKCISLRIRSWTSLNGVPKSRFESELDRFTQYLRIDEAKRDESETFCISR